MSKIRPQEKRRLLPDPSKEWYKKRLREEDGSPLSLIERGLLRLRRRNMPDLDSSVPQRKVTLQPDRAAAIAATRAKYEARSILTWLRPLREWWRKSVTQTDLVFGVGLIMFLFGIIVGLIAGIVKCLTIN